MLCDACGLPVVTSMTSFQPQHGEPVLGGGEPRVTRAQSPEAFVRCRSCGDAVAASVRYLVPVGGSDGFGPGAGSRRPSSSSARPAGPA